MHIVACATCFIDFGIPEQMERFKRKDHTWFYCPAGHQNRYSAESEEEKLRRERDLLKQQGAQKDDDIKRMREGWEKAEREKQRIEKRAKAALCPCCNRSFGNLARHMKTKHPDQNILPIGKFGPLKRKAKA